MQTSRTQIIWSTIKSHHRLLRIFFPFEHKLSLGSQVPEELTTAQKVAVLIAVMATQVALVTFLYTIIATAFGGVGDELWHGQTITTLVGCACVPAAYPIARFLERLFGASRNVVEALAPTEVTLRSAYGGAHLQSVLDANDLLHVIKRWRMGMEELFLTETSTKLLRLRQARLALGPPAKARRMQFADARAAHKFFREWKEAKDAPLWQSLHAEHTSSTLKRAKQSCAREPLPRQHQIRERAVRLEYKRVLRQPFSTVDPEALAACNEAFDMLLPSCESGPRPHAVTSAYLAATLESDARVRVLLGLPQQLHDGDGSKALVNLICNVVQSDARPVSSHSELLQVFAGMRAALGKAATQSEAASLHIVKRPSAAAAAAPPDPMARRASSGDPPSALALRKSRVALSDNSSFEALMRSQSETRAGEAANGIVRLSSVAETPSDVERATPASPPPSPPSPPSRSTSTPSLNDDGTGVGVTQAGSRSDSPQASALTWLQGETSRVHAALTFQQIHQASVKFPTTDAPSNTEVARRRPTFARMLSRERLQDMPAKEARFLTRCCSRRSAYYRASFISARVYRLADGWNGTTARFWSIVPWVLTIAIVSTCVLMSIVGGQTIASSARYVLTPWTSAIITALVFDTLVYSTLLALASALIYLRNAPTQHSASHDECDVATNADQVDGRGRFFFFSSERSWHQEDQAVVGDQDLSSRTNMVTAVAFDPRAPHRTPTPPQSIREGDVEMGYSEMEGERLAASHLEDAGDHGHARDHEDGDGVHTRSGDLVGDDGV